MKSVRYVFCVSAEDVKKKWKNLRDTYAKYIKTSKKAENRKKRWVWADHMESFRPYLSFTQASSNTSDIDDENGVAEVLLMESKVESGENCMSEHSENNLTGDTTDADPLHLQSSSKEPRIIASFQSPHSTQTSASNIILSRPRTIRKRSAQASSSSATEPTNYYENNTNTVHDGTDSLMLAHAKTIKTFSGRRQAITKMKIAEVIMEQELLHLEDVSSTEYLNYTYSSDRNT